MAFELGYLTPPVALNHLLTRQVVGEEEAVLAEQDARQASNWWYDTIASGYYPWFMVCIKQGFTPAVP